MVSFLLASPRLERGATMMEVLVTIVILAFGLLGLAGLQARLQVSEMESYQRAQALILLNDMASRIAANRNNAGDYVTGGSVGVGTNCSALPATTRQQMDHREWCNTLQGAAESFGDRNVGAMVGGRGCVEAIGTDSYLVTVAWQGMSAGSEPPEAVACGRNAYDDPGNGCSADRCRRVVTTTVRIGSLID